MRIQRSDVYYSHQPQSPTNVSTNAMHFRGTGSLLLENLGRVRKDFFHNFQNDTRTFQDNALIYASFLLVVSRLFAANKSMKQAKGTADEHYRRSEAIKTALREVGGFTFSFVVLRTFQALTGQLIANFFGLDRHNSLFKFTRKHLRDAFIWTFIKKKPLYVKQEFFTPTLRNPREAPKIQREPFEAPPGLHYPTDEETRQVRKVIPPNGQEEWWHNLNTAARHKTQRMVNYYHGLNLDRFFKDKAAGLTGAQQIDQIYRNINTLYKRVPIILGSIPAIILSGYVLEHFTQNHSNTVAKKAEQWLDKTRSHNKFNGVFHTEQSTHY